jgi:hypothetical protein
VISFKKLSPVLVIFLYICCQIVNSVGMDMLVRKCRAVYCVQIELGKIRDLFQSVGN